MVVCPVCSGDRAKDISATIRVARDAGLEEWEPNPGGSEMWFRDHGRLQLGDQCNACDEKAIRKFLCIVDGLPLPGWARHLTGAIVPPEIADRHPGDPEAALAEYLYGKGQA